MTMRMASCWVLAMVAVGGCFEEGVEVVEESTDPSGVETSSSGTTVGTDSSSSGSASSADSSGESGSAGSSSESSASSSGSESSSSSGSDSGDTSSGFSTSTTGDTNSTGTTGDVSFTSEVSSDSVGFDLGGGSEGSSFDLGGGSFIIALDAGGGQNECDIWAQDCLEGDKCMPWANDGGDAWNATRCSPIDGNGGAPGDACTVEGSSTSGIDSCELGAMCWNVDPDTNTGSCVAMCSGSEANPICDDPNTVCVIANEDVLILCLPSCDPLLQNCPAGDGCYPASDEFVCFPDGSEGGGAYGDFCETMNGCYPGGFCAIPEIVPGCMDPGCCSTFCDLDDGDPDAQCIGVADGQVCVPWYEEGMAPPGHEDVGACALPP